MTTLNEAREAIHARFVAQWGTTTRVFFENEKADPANPSSTDKNPWVRLLVQHRGGGQSTLGATGNRKFLRRGFVEIIVSTLANTGMAKADELVQTARGIFEATSFSGLDFTNGLPSEGPVNGRWQEMRVVVEFTYEEIK